MPSQEDYLDNLLRDVTESNELQESDPEQEGDPEQDNAAPDLDAVTGMSEDEIDRLLSAGSGQDTDELSSASDMDLSDEDVLKMLEDSDDEDLQDIQELLQKSDNNEAVDDSIAALLEDYPEEDLEAKILGDGEENGGRELRKMSAREKKELVRAKKERRKEEAAEKKAAKQAAKEAAKAARQAAKAEKAAAKEKSGKKQKPQKESLEDGMRDEMADQDLFDPSVLDSIVSEADRAGQKPEQSDEEAVPVSEAAEGGEEAQNFEENGINDSDLGLSNLFGGDDADSALFKDIGEEDGDSDFPDFLADGADALSDIEDLESREEKGAPKQKQGFFAKIMNFLTEEDEEENENIKLSKENQDILDDLDKETKGAKGKKGKKGKDKDEKKIKEKPKKEKKPKKPPKPKKEKTAKETPSVPEKKLSFKKMLPVLLVGLSVGVLLFVFVNSVTDYSDKRAAKAAYYEGDYQTCYQNLFGKDLNETESIMFGKSESILYIRLWIREFEMFMSEGDRVRALDSLIQTIDSYPELYAYAGQWNAESDIAAGYATILNYLSNEFGLTEGQAQTIAAVRSDREYTKMVTAIAGGRTFENWDAPVTPETPGKIPEAPEPEEDQIPDILPEEDELGKDTFIENQ